MRRRLIVGFVVVAVLVGVGARVTYLLVTAAEDLRDAENLVEQAADALADGELEAARSALSRAENLALDANESLQGSFLLDAIGAVPVARQNLASVRDTLDMALAVIHGGIRIIDTSRPLQSPSGTLEVSLAEGEVPVDAVEAAQREIASVALQLGPSLRRSRPSLLVGPIRELTDTVREEGEKRLQQLRTLDAGLDLVHEIAGGDGPRRYLLAVANTAEMRGSGGMILNYGVLEGRDGKLELIDFGRIDELVVPGPVELTGIPADYRARWDGFQAFRRFRQANLAGDFTVVAPVLEALYTSATKLPVYGVIQIDPAGLAAVLEGVGPVDVPEVGEVTADNVVPLTLNEAYFRFPDVETRSDVLGDVAEAAFRKLVEGDYPSLRGLAAALAGAVDGRHIVMHATSSELQGSVAAFGADGAYPAVEGGPDHVALTAQNLAGNKLDYYLDTDLAVTGEQLEGEVGAWEATVTLTNTAPDGATTPQYVFGPGPGDQDLAAGVIRSLVTLYLPVGTSLESSSGDDTVEPVTSGTEADRPYVSFTFDVPAGESRQINLMLQLAPRAPGAYELVMSPSPRVRPTSVTVEIDTGGAGVGGQVVLDRTWSFRTGRTPEPVLAPLYR